MWDKIDIVAACHMWNNVQTKKRKKAKEEKTSIRI